MVREQIKINPVCVYSDEMTPGCVVGHTTVELDTSASDNCLGGSTQCCFGWFHGPKHTKHQLYQLSAQGVASCFMIA